MKQVEELHTQLVDSLRVVASAESRAAVAEARCSDFEANFISSRDKVVGGESGPSTSLTSEIQVREMNLLRESNLQLREENKHNFEECQKLRELAQKARVEMDQLESILKEKNIEVDSCRKEIEMKKIEKVNLENRITELLEACKNIDVDDYNRLKNDCQQMQVKLKAIEVELDETKKLVLEKQDFITRLEQELASARIELAEREKKIKENLNAEATLKSETEKFRKAALLFKRKCDTVTKEKEELSKNATKEKEELSKDKSTLQKQLEEYRQSKRQMVDAASEQEMKDKLDKDALRMQMLEKTLEREREELKKSKDEVGKEKSRRLRTEKAVEDLFKKAEQGKAQVLEEVEKYKKLRESHLEGGAVSQTPDADIDNPVASYLQTMENLEEAVSTFVIQTRAQSLEPPSASAPQAVVQSLPTQSTTTTTAVGPSQTKTSDQREKRSITPKPISEEKRSSTPKPPAENRKFQRRLVRPNLTAARAQEPSGDTEMAEVEGVTNTDSKKDLPLGPRKRLVSTLSDSQIPSETSSVPVVPPLSKKSRSEHVQESTETPPQSSVPVVPPVSKKSKSEHVHENTEMPTESAVPVVPPVSKKSRTDHPQESTEIPSQSSVLVVSPVSKKSRTEQPQENTEIPPENVEVQQSSPAMDESLSLDATNDNSTVVDLEEDNNETQNAELLDASEEEEEQDPEQIAAETESDREEGELPSDMVDEQDGDLDVPPSPAIDEELDSTVDELIETVDEKIDAVGEGVEETTEELSEDKSGNDDDQSITDPERSPRGGTDQVASDQPGNMGTPVIEEEESPAEKSTTRTINLTERAIARSQLRKKGLTESPSTSATTTITTTSSAATTEGGRPTPLRREGARAVRGIRGVRGRSRGGRRPNTDEAQG